MSLHIYSDKPMDEENVKKKLRDYFTQGRDNIQFGIRKLTMQKKNYDRFRRCEIIIDVTGE